MMKARKRIGCLVFGVFLSLGRVGPAAAGEVWVPPTHFVAPSLTSFPWPTSGAGFASFGFAVPDDFAALTSTKVVLIPKNNLGGSFNVYGSVKRDGEIAGEGLLNFAIPATLAAGTVQEVDITALLAGQLEATSAGQDYVSVFFWFPASPGLEDATVLGLRFTYDAVRIQTAELENGAITTPKLENGAVTNAKLADNSVGTDKVVNGSIGAVDINKSEVQARVADSCPPGQSIRSIHVAGGVVCEPDTAGLTSYVRATNLRNCIAGQYCSAEVFCLGGRFAMGGGMQSRDRFLELVLSESYPSSDHSWRVVFRNNNSFAVDVDVYVTCSSEATGAASSSAAAAAAPGPHANRPLSRK